MGRLNPAKIALAERDAKAFRLRVNAVPWSEIARECGFTKGKNPEKNAMMAVKRYTERMQRQTFEEGVSVQRERLENLLRAVAPSALNPVAAEQAHATGRAPKPIPQDKAIELMRRLLDDLAKVEGTYAPQRAEVTGPDGGPIQQQVLVWQPDAKWLAEYARAVEELPPDVRVVSPEPVSDPPVRLLPPPSDS